MSWTDVLHRAGLGVLGGLAVIAVIVAVVNVWLELADRPARRFTRRDVRFIRSAAGIVRDRRDWLTLPSGLQIRGDELTALAAFYATAAADREQA